MDVITIKKERVNERLIEKIDISFALTIDVHMILSLTKVDDWEFKGLFGVLLDDNVEEQRWVCEMIPGSYRALRMFIEQSHDEVYGYHKGGSRNSRGKRLAISMVEEAWLSEKEDV
ncbi:hypothetical protein Tco_0835105 [Tanacetum coccineum]